MTLKDFDIKQFMLKYGEWVGLGVAVAIMLPAFVIGAMNVLTSGSARANANDIDKLANAADTKITQSNPPEDADKPPPEGALVVRMDRVDPEKYQPPGEWFIPSSFEDTKRRAPVVMSPGDFQSTIVRGGMLGHVFMETNGQMRALVIREKQRDKSPREKRWEERIKKWQKDHGQAGGGLGGMGMPGMGGPGSTGLSGRMGGGKGGMGGMGGPPGMGGTSMPGSGVPANMVKNLELMDVDKIANEQNVHFAEKLYPVRMAVVTGTFPFKQQLESFRIALRKQNLNELMSILETPDAPFEFAGLEIDRRVLYPDGREKSPWKRHDEEMRALWKRYMARAVDAEKEDPELRKFWGIVNRGGLIWARPVLALPYRSSEEESRYPKVEIPSLKDAVAELEKKGTENAPKVPNRITQKIKGKFDPENPDDPLGVEDETKMEQQPENATKPPEDEPTKTGEEEPVVPDKALVRFLDMTIEPGYVYEYRVRVKMTNPNFKKDKDVAYPALAKNKHIIGDNSQVIRVDVPWETDWYVMDDRPSERLTVQIQKWLDVAAPEPNMDQNLSDVADWIIDERASASRGEYIGRPDLVQVPTWSMVKEDWEIARNAKRGGTRLQVDFTVKTNQQFPTLLIDYEGGKGREVRFNGRPITDEAPVQALILTPEGKLEVRTNLEDKENGNRKERYDEWKKRMEEIKNPTKRKKEQQNLFDKNRGGPSQ